MDEIQFAEYLEKKKQDSGNITYIYSDKHVRARNRKKVRTLIRLAKTIEKLRRKVAEDLDSPEKGELAMVVALIDETYERVGNPDSAKENHFGVTTWRKKHVSFPGSKAVIKYKGKAGVDQKKTVTSKRVVSLLKGLVAERKADEELFPDITSSMVNEYLKPFKITAKDIRGFHANEEMKKALGKAKKKGGDEKQRKEEFKKALEETAKIVGHDPGTLKKDYLVPSFEENYLEHGRIGAKSSSAADKENRYMPYRTRTAGHLNRMLALRKLANKDKKKKWEKDSAMLAIMAPPGIVRKLRKVVDHDTVSPDGLHVTLLFLGKVADLDKPTMAAIQRAAEKVCARHQPLAMRVSGAGMFAPGEDGTPVYIVPNAKGLSALQADLENAVGSIIDLPSEHGWVPHMTVAYSCEDRPSPPELKEYPEWTAKAVRLQAGGRALADLPLGRKRKADADFPLSRRAEEDDDDPLRNWPPPGEEREPDPWKQYEDPVKHQREDRPRITMPWNIPDMQVIWAEGLEGEQKIPLSEGLDESDPGGKYVVQDIADRELARYDTEEKAIENAKKTEWSWRVLFIGPYDDIDTAIVEGPEKVSIPWSRPREEVRRMIDETMGGPYYLKDYWGRTVASFSDREKAIENAERNMYISHVVGSLTGDPDRGETIWKKPKSGGGMQMADDKFPGFFGPIEKQTEENEDFRRVLFTGKNSQLVLMSVKGGEELGEETHPDIDQFFRIEEGSAVFVLNGVEQRASADDAVVIPAGTRHNVINASKTEPLKVYTIYSPPNHPPDTVHTTKEDAEKAEKKEHKAEDGAESPGQDAIRMAGDIRSQLTDLLLKVLELEEPGLLGPKTSDALLVAQVSIAQAEKALDQLTEALKGFDRSQLMDPERMADDASKAAGFIGRMIRLAERLDDSGDHEGAERLCRQMDFLVSRRAHFVPSKETKTPPMWRKNLDYGEDSPYFGSVKEFLKKYKGGLAEYIKKRRKSRKKRERKWRLASIAGSDDVSMRDAIDSDMENSLIDAPQNRLDSILDISHSTDEALEAEQGIRDDYIKDPAKAPREFVKYWSILLKNLGRKRRKRKGRK